MSERFGKCSICGTQGARLVACPCRRSDCKCKAGICRRCETTVLRKLAFQRRQASER